MAIEIILPRLGWSMEEGTFSGWLKENGEAVAAGEPLFSVESDKVTMDVESLDAGILYIPPDGPEMGAVVMVGQRLGYLLAQGEEPPEGSASVPAGRPVAVPVEVERVGEAAGPRLERRAITPRARRVAAELGVDTAGVEGTGKGGRVREADVQAALERRGKEAAVPITTLRRTIAARMMESKRNTAPVTLTSRADVTELVAVREKWKAAAGSEAPSYTDMLAKVAAQALAAHPEMNSRWSGDQLIVPSQVHIGLAVDTEQGLLVPVLRDVGRVSLKDLARRSRELIAAARERRLRPEDLEGGTFTISNLGSYGIDAFTPIIHYPETAVLGVGAIRKEMTVMGSGQFGVRDWITLSLTFDHRVVDGAPAARFLQRVVKLIETPAGALGLSKL